MDIADLLNSLTLISLIAIMLSMGLNVCASQVLDCLRKPRQVASGLMANFVLVPVITLVLLRVFSPDPMVAAGFLILAVCPGAPVGPAFTATAKGDVAYATGQMVVLATVSSLVTPALLVVLLARILPPEELKVDYVAIVSILAITQITPLGIGLAVHHWAPRLSRRIDKPIEFVAAALLLCLIVLLLVDQHETLAMVRPRGWLGILMLLGASMCIGWICGGPTPAKRKAMSITTALRNVAVALVIVTDNRLNTAAQTAVVAYALVSLLATLGLAFLLALIPGEAG